MSNAIIGSSWLSAHTLLGVPTGTPVTVRQRGKGAVHYSVTTTPPDTTTSTTLARGKPGYTAPNAPGLFLRSGGANVNVELVVGVSAGAYLLSGPEEPAFGKVVNSYPAPADADGYWVMGDENLHIKAGSALDLSGVNTTAVPAGSRGRIQASTVKPNMLIESGVPAQYVTFNIAAYAGTTTYTPIPSDKPAITAGALQLKRCGFNAVRIHGIENFLMAGVSGEACFDGVRLDSFYYFLAECKRLGIYWIVDAASFNLYRDMAGATNRYAYTPETNAKTRIYTEQGVRDMWKRGFAKIYNSTNPYTGLTTFEDPALILVELYNESSYPLNTISGFPLRWVTRTSGALAGAMTWPEWIQTPTASHGYATLADLNTSWGTAFASYALAGADPLPAVNGATATSNRNTDIALYIVYLEEHLGVFYKDCILEWGYTGLTSMHNIFAGNLTNRQQCKMDINQVANSHGYHSGSNDINPGSTLDGGKSNPVYGNESWVLGSMLNGGGKPRWLGEYGWPAWSRYRAQYPLLACVARFNSASAFSHFSQGDFFSPTYFAMPGERGKRFRKLYPYMNQTDPVADFTRTLIALCFARGDATTSNYTSTFVYSDRYYGLSPRNAARGYRLHGAATYPLIYAAAMQNCIYKWTNDTADDTMAVTTIAKSLKDLYTDSLATGAVRNDNRGYVSVLANSGTILGVTTTDLINSIQASATAPIIQVASHTMVDADKIQLLNLTGTAGTWPGTSVRNALYDVKRVDDTHIQILNHNLSAATVNSFTAGSWCEAGNVIEAGNGEWGWSRREQFAWINTSKTVYLSNVNTTLPKAVGPVVVESLTAGSSFFISALDNRPITTSSKLLVGLVGDAINSGMSFTDAHVTISAPGEYPALVSDSYVKFKLNRTVTGRGTITPLTRSGEPANDVMSLVAFNGGYRVNCRNVDGIIFWVIELKA